MPDLISSKTVTARKPHACMCCGATAIQPGDRYVREAMLNDGSVYNWISCVACKEIAEVVWDWCYYSDEGIGKDEYNEWASDNAWDPEQGESARAYLARAGSELPDNRTVKHAHPQHQA